MNPKTKQVLNIGSYVLNVLLLGTLLVFLITGNKDRTTLSGDKMVIIKNTIVKGEIKRLPVTIQKVKKNESIFLPTLNNITIDSLVITSPIKPYRGYLVTTWTRVDGRKKSEQTVYVDVTDISMARNGVVGWTTHWNETL